MFISLRKGVYLNKLISSLSMFLVISRQSEIHEFLIYSGFLHGALQIYSNKYSEFRYKDLACHWEGKSVLWRWIKIHAIGVNLSFVQRRSSLIQSVDDTMTVNHLLHIKTTHIKYQIFTEAEKRFWSTSKYILLYTSIVLKQKKSISVWHPLRHLKATSKPSATAKSISKFQIFGLNKTCVSQ